MRASFEEPGRFLLLIVLQLRQEVWQVLVDVADDAGGRNPMKCQNVEAGAGLFRGHAPHFFDYLNGEDFVEALVVNTVLAQRFQQLVDTMSAKFITF